MDNPGTTDALVNTENMNEGSSTFQNEDQQAPQNLPEEWSTES